MQMAARLDSISHHARPGGIDLCTQQRQSRWKPYTQARDAPDVVPIHIDESASLRLDCTPESNGVRYVLSCRPQAPKGARTQLATAVSCVPYMRLHSLLFQPLGATKRAYRSPQKGYAQDA